MWDFAKGHGTRNDFVLLTDPEGLLELTPERVRFLCDRRAGIGADGVLRAVRARHIEEWTGDPDLWFMDYRNADGSLAEMCGNGLRVFARNLFEEGLAAEGPLLVGTRAGLRSAQPLADGSIRIGMGIPAVHVDRVRVSIGARSWVAHAADVGNPHAVVVLDRGDVLADLDLTRPPAVSPEEAFPAGVNVEFVEPLGEGHVRMRVHERGVGETCSCGTGTVAVAATMAALAGVPKSSWRVDVLGGELQIDLHDDQEATLTGPAAIVARGRVDVP